MHKKGRNPVNQSDTFASDFGVFDSARRVMETYPSPLVMDDTAIHAVDAALDNFTSACLLITRGCYTTTQWWEFAHVAISDTARDTAMAASVLVAPVSEGTEVENAVVAARDTTRRVVHGGEHPGKQFFAAIAQAMSKGAEEEIPRVRGAVSSLVYDTYGNALVEVGEIDQDELIEYQIESATSSANLEDELALAVEYENLTSNIESGKRPDNSGDVVSLRIHATTETIVDADNEGDLEALRYLYNDAREDMIELISTDTFSPERAAGSDAAVRLADVFEFEPLILALISEFSPSVRVLGHVYDAAGHDTMAHVNIAAQVPFVLSGAHADCFDEDDEGITVEPTPAFSADLELVRSVIEDAESVSGDGVSTHALATWTEHDMAVTTLMEEGAGAAMRGDEEAAEQAALPLRLLSNPFNKSVFSAIYIFGFGQAGEAGFVSRERVELWQHTCDMALSVIQGDEETIEKLRHVD